MNRKISYIDCYNGAAKEGNIGFARVEDERLHVVLRGLAAGSGVECPVYAERADGERERILTVPLRGGYGQAQGAWGRIARAQCHRLYLPLYGNLYGVSVLQESAAPAAELTPAAKEPQPRVITPFAEELGTLHTDKWERLCHTYPQVHIFPEADTLVIKPKDLVVLTQEYQELAANSFVLHAYYNYRQLLLLRYAERGQSCYYLGVPGIYYEREQRIAQLFGFEGFENGESRLVNGESRRAYLGCFGYYMKRVEL